MADMMVSKTSVKAKSPTRLFEALLLAAAFVVFVICISGCASDSGTSGNAGIQTQANPISVYTREDGSGTRSAFIELLGIQQGDVDMTTDSAAVTNSTAVMMTAVQGDPAGIGYISMGSMNDTVKAVDVDGVEATTDNVKSGDYPISRPFNIVTQDGLSDVAQDFIDYILSADGQAVVSDEGYIAIDDSVAAYSASGLSGRVVVAGSSSVTPVMERLAEEYQALNPEVTVEVNQSDSTTGVNMAIEGTCDIGMASRDLAADETSSGVSATAIAQDGIAVIVNNSAAVTSLTSDTIMQIYTGAITDWADVE